MKINLNADMGESYGAWRMGDDEGLLRIVGAANIACGFHGGDPLTMRATVRGAQAAGVEIGAHPSLPDLVGFGRRAMAVTPAEAEAMTIYQIGALAAVAAAEGARVVHVKPHGALNAMAWRDEVVADAVARGIRAVDPSLILLACAATALARAGERAGLTVAQEIFADRTYTEAGDLTPRSEPHALIRDAETAVAQIMRFLDAGGIVTPSGATIPTALHSVCVHGDGKTAVELAGAVRAGLVAKGVDVVGLTAALG